jgi:transcriptional regulator with XRE-family HTH domain
VDDSPWTNSPRHPSIGGVPKAPPHPTLKAMGRRIRLERERLKWSQETLADEASLDRSYMSGIERGIRNISVIKLFEIANALGVPPSVLLDKSAR